MINNLFPATLHPGSCLNVVIRYQATERYPRSCDLVITSDDPALPAKTLEVLAATIWDDCGCKKCADDCRKHTCDPCGGGGHYERDDAEEIEIDIRYGGEASENVAADFRPMPAIHLSSRQDMTRRNFRRCNHNR